jgi:hypothetical protein
VNAYLICTLIGLLCGLGTGYALWYGQDALADSTGAEPEDADHG